MPKKRVKLQHGTSFGRNLREFIFGVEDGLITTFGIVVGFTAAALGPSIIILAGLIEMFAAAISMSAGSYLSTKSQREFYERELAREREEIKKNPKQEREEIRKIYKEKGFVGKELDRIVKLITSDREIWLKVISTEELGVIGTKFLNEKKAALVMGLSFLVGAVIPLLPYFFLEVNIALPLSIILTIIALFSFGALKTKVTKKSWFKSGFEMAFVGMLAGLAGYLIGYLFGKF